MNALYAGQAGVEGRWIEIVSAEIGLRSEILLKG